MITPSSSSTHGLIHALKLTQQGSASAIELTADGDATWLHFDAADPETSQWLRSEGGLNMVAAGALTTEETRPRVLRGGDNLVLALREVNRLPGADAEDMVSLRIWTNGSRLISARLRPLQSTDRLVDELLSGEEPIRFQDYWLTGLSMSWMTWQTALRVSSSMLQPQKRPSTMLTPRPPDNLLLCFESARFNFAATWHPNVKH
ncbi:MAG TPA: hypothetical protein DHV35_07930 [Halieaceae bacterium]|nr:hypothetical protein [Halieaceae bacterium]